MVICWWIVAFSPSVNHKLKIILAAYLEECRSCLWSSSVTDPWKRSALGGARYAWENCVRKPETGTPWASSTDKYLFEQNLHICIMNASTLVVDILNLSTHLSKKG